MKHQSPFAIIKSEKKQRIPAIGRMVDDMKEECLICKAPLEYLQEDIEMECELCHKKEKSKTRCINGHYVCNECHMKGIDSLVGLCMSQPSKNPVVILNEMMALPFCHMHGPEHHIMVGMALLTAYKNSGGELELKNALNAIGEIGGPRCCKRDSYLSILKAVDFVKENLGISMERPEIRCSFRSKNNQCVGKRCPFCK